jgi:hypothetical protein
MDCGASLAGDLTPARARQAMLEGDSVQQPESTGTNWTTIATAIVAFFGIRHLSRGARNTVVLLAFLFLFFGCPLICGFVMFVMEWLARLFGF